MIGDFRYVDNLAFTQNYVPDLAMATVPYGYSLHVPWILI